MRTPNEYMSAFSSYHALSLNTSGAMNDGEPTKPVGNPTSNSRPVMSCHLPIGDVAEYQATADNASQQRRVIALTNHVVTSSHTCD